MLRLLFLAGGEDEFDGKEWDIFLENCGCWHGERRSEARTQVVFFVEMCFGGSSWGFLTVQVVQCWRTKPEFFTAVCACAVLDHRDCR